MPIFAHETSGFRKVATFDGACTIDRIAKVVAKENLPEGVYAMVFGTEYEISAGTACNGVGMFDAEKSTVTFSMSQTAANGDSIYILLP